MVATFELMNDVGRGRQWDPGVTRWYSTAIDIDDRKQAEERLRQENTALREEIDETSMFEEIVGTSSALRAVLSRIAKVAPSDSTVLITRDWHWQRTPRPRCPQTIS